MWGIRRRILVAFRECFGGVSRVVWWRFEDGLMAFESALLTIAQCLSYE